MSVIDKVYDKVMMLNPQLTPGKASIVTLADMAAKLYGVGDAREIGVYACVWLQLAKTNPELADYILQDGLDDDTNTSNIIDEIVTDLVTKVTEEMKKALVN